MVTTAEDREAPGHVVVQAQALVGGEGDLVLLAGVGGEHVGHGVGHVVGAGILVFDVAEGLVGVVFHLGLHVAAHEGLQHRYDLIGVGIAEELGAI